MADNLEDIFQKLIRKNDLKKDKKWMLFWLWNILLVYQISGMIYQWYIFSMNMNLLLKKDWPRDKICFTSSDSNAHGI